MEIDYKIFNPYVVACGYVGIDVVEEAGIEFPIRVVKWYELELYHKVNEGYIINRDHRVNLKKGLLMIRKPGTVVRGVSSYECHSIGFDNLYDEKLSQYYSEEIYKDPTTDLLTIIRNKTSKFLDNLPDTIEIEDYAYVKGLFKECLELYLKQDEDFQFYGKQLIYTILKAVMDQHQKKLIKERPGILSGTQSIMGKSRDYIEVNYANAISLDELSELAGYSREAYCRLFKKIYNKSPIDYLVHVRIINAKRLLITTNLSIYEIALECGFNNDTYFYSVFKKRVGMSPKMYRDSNRFS